MKFHRKKLRLSQADLAEKIGTAPNYISKIEAEKQFPSVQMIENIASALEVDTVDLFSCEQIKKSDLSKIKTDLLKEINEAVTANFDKIVF